MTSPRHLRMSPALRAFSRGAPRDMPNETERLLRGIGADPCFTDDVLGDLAEERARRTTVHGSGAARRWYVREAIRAVPYLIWNAARHGGARGRTRVAAMCAALALGPALVLAAPLLVPGPPVRLVVETQGARDLSDGIVVNSRRPVRLGVSAMDARGHRLGGSGIHYRVTGGAPLAVSGAGVVTCARTSDSEVRASLGGVSATMLVRCRPVSVIWDDVPLALILGERPRELTFNAVGPDNQVVNRITGDITIGDRRIATLRDNQVVPLSAGRTEAHVRVGDAKTDIPVTVHEPVATLADLGDDQRYVAARLRMAPGDTLRWPLPTTGRLWLTWRPATRGQAPPDLAVFGRIRCMPGGFGPPNLGCVARAPGAYIRIAHPATADSLITGWLLLDHDTDP